MKCAGINPQGCVNTWCYFALPKDPDKVAELDKCLLAWQDANPGGNYSLNRNAHPGAVLDWATFRGQVRAGVLGHEIAAYLRPLVGPMYWASQAS